MNLLLSEQQIFDLRQAFSSVDYDNTGFVSTKDIPRIFSHLDETFKPFIVEGDDLTRFLEQIDIEESNQITFPQFLTVIAYKININDTVEELTEAFRMFDRKNSGYINFDDLWHVMQSFGENLTESEVSEMMREADRDLDGKISFAEFVEMIRYQ